MHIGELASLAGCPLDTVRYYEKQGLLPPAARSPGNYRLYGSQHVARLAFIRHCRSLDMSLSEIRVLLDAIAHPDADCRPVNALLDAHIRHVAKRMAELGQLKTELDAIRAHCNGSKPIRRCGILASLAAPQSAAKRTR